MSRKWKAASGGIVAFIAAGVAGVAGNQLSDSPLWGWLGFVGALLVGAAATAWIALKTSDAGPSPQGAPSQGDMRVGTVTASDSGTAIGINFGEVRTSRPDPETPPNP
ncbi:hypothetical protein [Streptosporangium sp. G12]